MHNIQKHKFCCDPVTPFCKVCSLFVTEQNRFITFVRGPITMNRLATYVIYTSPTLFITSIDRACRTQAIRCQFLIEPICRSSSFTYFCTSHRTSQLNRHYGSCKCPLSLCHIIKTPEVSYVKSILLLILRVINRTFDEFMNHKMKDRAVPVGF